MFRLSIVVPAKNEAANLKRWLPDLVKWGGYDELIVVDDGSTDHTAEIAKEFGAVIVRHPNSLGNGAAVKSGARAAKGDYILFMDGDGQHQVKDIPVMLDTMTDGCWDMVVGARSRTGQASFARFMANGFYNWFASKVSGRPIKDLTSGFRLVRRELFVQFLYLLPNGFSYPTTSTMAFLRAGYSVTFQPIEVLRREGKSHISPLKDGMRFFIIIFKVATLYAPLRVFIPLALFHFLLGVLRYIYTYSTEGTFTNMSALLMVTGVQIFLVGLISEQISALGYRRNQ